MEYKGYTIIEETDPWAIFFGSKVNFFIDEEKIYSADSFEDAIEQINEMENPLFV